MKTLKRLTFEIAQPLAAQLKVAAALTGTTQTSIVREAIQERVGKILKSIGVPLVRINGKAKERKP